MRKKSKKSIHNIGIGGGGSLDLRDVATVSRDKRVVKLRHAWHDPDGRVWDAISRAYRRGAQDLANKTGKNVEVYTREGDMLGQWHPDEEYEPLHTHTRRSR